MAKSRIVVRKLIWACIILWIIFCIGKGVYEEMVKFGEEIDVIERKKQQNETCNVILENVHKKHVHVCCSNVAAITIAKNVEVVGREFSGCTNLISVTISDGVKEIGSGAFMGCTSLATVIIPDSVSVIEKGAFWGCVSLTSVTMPNSLEKIGDSAFFLCDKLTVTTGKGYVSRIKDLYRWSECVKFVEREE